jgi:alkylhydroperoxidase family enzyme
MHKTMQTRIQIALPIVVALACVPAASFAAEPVSDKPKVVPQTRPEMKKLLEGLKQRQPRLPLPPAEETGTGEGGRPSVNNGRMRQTYLPASWQGSRGGGREPDTAMTLDDTFKVRLFWIVSRGNNCHYCLGHQELKLRRAGMLENEIASLDCDWKAFPEAEQAAFDFTRKLTITPHLVNDKDFEVLRKHYNDAQLIEMIYTVARYNSTNRWTDSLGIPQDQRFGDEAAGLDTPTADEFKNRPTTVVESVDPRRPALEDADEVRAQLAAARKRHPRVAILSQEKARAALPADHPEGALPNWVRAIMQFPKTGSSTMASLHAMEKDGKISPKLKAQIAWVAARNNRAWYAAGQAMNRLQKLGVSEADVLALDGDQKSLAAGEREALKFAAKLTASPKAIADADIANLRKHFPDAEVAEIVQVTCQANMFDRFTEALGLTLE